MMFISTSDLLSRETAADNMGVVNSLAGLGLDPVLVGTLSDVAARSSYGVSATDCAVMASAACTEGSYLGLRASLVIAAVSLAHIPFPARRLAAGGKTNPYSGPQADHQHT